MKGQLTLPNPSHRGRGYSVLPLPFAGEGWGEGDFQQREQRERDHLMNDKKITFVVGAEKKLADIVTEADILPLLKGAVNAGASAAAIADMNNRPLWQQGAYDPQTGETASLPLLLEGEPVGSVLVQGAQGNPEFLRGVAGLLRETLTAIINTNMKRMLATEIHTSVVNLSHDELLEVNAKLRLSETKYRELAENLEKKVIERTGELKKAHAKLLQQEKIVSIGQLAAGIAHEVNNPLGFIISNLNAMNKYLERLNEMLAFYQASLQRGATTEAQKAAQERHRELKIDFVLSDAKELIKQSLSGADRVKKIVSDLKAFSHVDETSDALIDVNKELDKTLSVLTHEIPASAKVIRDFQPLPPFIGNPALLCQVFLNLVLNALQARQDGLVITISTRAVLEGISIRVIDNGPGIPAEIRDRIFDPFFTTKDVGKGTGMGLTVVYDIILSYHGTIQLEDAQPGTGASFLITLPVQGGRHVEVR